MSNSSTYRPKGLGPAVHGTAPHHASGVLRALFENTPVCLFASGLRAALAHRPG